MKIVTVVMLMWCLVGCAAIPFGMTLYKSEKQYGPSMEVILLKVQFNTQRIDQRCQMPICKRCQPPHNN